MLKELSSVYLIVDRKRAPCFEKFKLRSYLTKIAFSHGTCASACVTRGKDKRMLFTRIGLIVATVLGASACNDAGSPEGSSMVAKSDATRAVVGDLGGVPVKIPLEFAKSVEYDDDPAVLQPRSQPAPARNSLSKLRSFGFDFRYPDMAGPGSVEARKDKASHLPGNTFWIFVGLNAGQDYRGAGSAERLASATLSSADPATMAFYRRAAEKTCGLETYVLTGVDPKSGRLHREDPSAEDVFVSRDAAGRATTFIECSNRPLDAAPCSQYFDLEPDVQAKVYLKYRRGLLCEWQGIQSATSQLISSFRVTGNTNLRQATASSHPNTTNSKGK